MSVELVETLSHTLTDADLADAISILIKARKQRQGAQLLEMKNPLSTGDAVEFYHSGQGKYIQGTVQKVKTKKAIVWEDGHSTSPTQTWDVPMGMLKKVSVVNEQT